jgi:hypothetical protein
LASRLSVPPIADAARLLATNRMMGESALWISSSNGHATALYLLGLDHEKLTFYHNGINRRLTDVHGHVLKPLLA